MTRIQLDHTVINTITIMADGNPGALTVLIQLVERSAVIDPDDMLAPYGAIFHLDSIGIYGSDIWVLYKDICDQDLIKMIAVLRAWQMGFCTAQQVRLIKPGTGFADHMLTKVKEVLPNFGKE